MNSDQKLGIGLIVFCSVMWFYAIPFRIVGDAPKFFPRLIVFFILIPSILLILTRRVSGTAVRQPFGDRKELHKSFTTAVFFLIYIALIDIVGYFTTSFFAVAGFLYFFGERNWKRILIVPATILFFVYFIIEKMLSFPLPKGFIY
jgi:hypothetical protein